MTPAANARLWAYECYLCPGFRFRDYTTEAARDRYWSAHLRTHEHAHYEIAKGHRYGILYGPPDTRTELWALCPYCQHPKRDHDDQQQQLCQAAHFARLTATSTAPTGQPSTSTR